MSTAFFPTPKPNRLPEQEFFQNFKTLNEAQKSAICTQGYVLVSAGAGTGKTQVLILRYAYLVQVHCVSLSHIIAVTFTRRAAQELQERLEILLSIQSNTLWIGTFHGLALRILKSAPERIKRTSAFSIVNNQHQEHIIATILQCQEISPKEVLEQIHQWKCQTWLPWQVPSTQNTLYLKVYHQYQQELEITNSLDLDDLLLLSYHVFNTDPSFLRQWQKQFTHILVDEYQDINTLEYGWLKLLSAQAESLFCVGDEDQSIYAWKGARIEHILRFQEDFPKACIIALEENYRSSPFILSGANALISINPLRGSKVLRTQRQEGEKIYIQSVWSPQKEVQYVIKKVFESRKKGRPYAGMAILMRTKAQSQEFEAGFLAAQIPYHSMDSPHLYEPKEIDDLLTYLRWIQSPNDNEAFKKVINTPSRGIGLLTLEKIASRAHTTGRCLEHAARALCREGLKCSALDVLLYQVNVWRNHQGSVQKLALRVLQESGYLEYLRKQGKSTVHAQAQFKEFLKILEKFKNLNDCLDHVNLFLKLRAQASQDGVFMLTFHAAKGLEFDEIFLVGWEKSLFPHVRSLEAQNMEEERRLAYVALTRARERVHISFCWNRTKLKKFILSSPSCFIQELPVSATNRLMIQEFGLWILSRGLFLIRQWVK